MNEHDLPEASFVVFTEIIDSDGYVWHPTVRKGVTEADIRGMFAAMSTLKNHAAVNMYKPYVRQSGYPKKTIEYIEGRVCALCSGRLIQGTGKMKERCENYKYDMTQKKNVGTCGYIIWN